MKPLIIVFISVTLTACATGPSMKQKAKAWIGKDISEYISTAGAPVKTMELPNGKTIYEFLFKGNTVASAYNTGYSTDVTATSRDCKATLTVDKKSIIRQYSWYGYCN